MISDKKLMKVSLVVALAGIAMIFFAGQLAVQNTTISQIKEIDAGKQVIINGIISSYRNSNGNIFFQLGDGTGNITVVMFERTARGQPAAKNGDNVTINGQINVYKNELEIIASSITRVE